jgi:hypothetical protein
MHYATLRHKWPEFRAGWGVIGILLRESIHGEPRVTWPSPSGAFYPLGWWWEGEHVLVPQMLEEERIAAELEKTFGAIDEVFIWGDGVKVRAGKSVKVGTPPTGSIAYSSGTVPSFPIVAQDSYSDALVVTPPGGTPVGYWMWESVKMGTTTPPHPIRQWLLKTLIGATYSPILPSVPKAPTKSSSPTPLSVLESCLGSAPTPPTLTSSE